VMPMKKMAASRILILRNIKGSIMFCIIYNKGKDTLFLAKNQTKHVFFQKLWRKSFFFLFSRFLI
jgi:hypothetical protein